MIHSRTPVVIPERLDEGLAALLASPRWRATLVLHANHPREISPALAERCRALGRGGVTLLNQSVLLAGVNDDAEALASLSDALFEAGVLTGCRGSWCPGWRAKNRERVQKRYWLDNVQLPGVQVIFVMIITTII